MEVILIRHTSVDVPPGTCYGQTDVPVRDTFEEEAARTKAELESYGPIDIAYASPLTRARLLAAYCGFPQPRLDNRLKEMNMGQWEMQRYDDLTDDYAKRWYDDYMHLPTPDGEGFPDVLKRVGEFLDELRQKDYRRVAIFAHGGVLVCAGIHAGLWTLEDGWSHHVDYGGVMRIELAQKG